MHTPALTANQRKLSEDSILIQHILAGEEDAFEILMQRYRGVLFSLICSYMRDCYEADDILQEVFLQLHLSLGTIKPEIPLKAWLYKVARHRCIDRLRRKRPVYFSELDVEGEESELSPYEELPDTSPLPEELAERHEVQLCLREAIQTLPPRYRRVISLRCGAEMSYRTIGQALNIPETTAKTHYYRAKQLLRAALEANVCLHQDEATGSDLCGA